MRKNTNVATLVDLRKRKTVGRMTIGINLGDRKSHFCVLNDEAQVITRGGPWLSWACFASSEADVKIAAPSIAFGPQHAPSTKMLTNSANRRGA